MHGGQAMLKAIERSGVEFILSSPGSEWPPVWEALAEAAARGAEQPKYINCRHEAVAVAMAAGYTKVTHRPQVVMLHATAGPLNAAMTLRAALHERTPMVILSGEIAAYGENTKVADPGGQWLHDLTDLGGSPDLLRSCVKWADRISSAELLGSSIERAVRIATEPPAGPVLIGIPFECMMEEVSFVDHGKPNEVVRAHEVNDGAIDKALSLIAAAKNPVALTEHVGGDPRAFERFVELCELFSIPVMETYRPAFMNFPRSHPLYLHHDAKFVDAADLVLMVDAVTPWYPASKTPKNAKIICIADEYPNSRLPYWGYNVDLALVAPPAFTLEKLIKKAQSSEQVAANREAYKQRLTSVRDRHNSYFEKLKDEARKHANETPIDPRWACHVLGEALPDNAVISEETTVYRNLIQETIPRDRPQSYFARVTGGLGVGLSYALGVKLALPDRPVFALIGDGAFHYNAVPSCLGVAEEYGLPIHAVVFNNGRYLSMETSLIKYFPTGAAKQTGVHFGANIGPRPDY
ncbi:MAG TPA: thiamine pyrophosphate-binding protein, partial [Candidatus Binatia bacterium]|nr:thiamine pyrophosphate-binding protein [Candidatus Binatia bacterium]